MKIRTLLNLAAVTAMTLASVWGCEPDKPAYKPDKPTRPLSRACNLTSFSIDKVKNKLAETITFSLNEETDTYSAIYLKWIEGTDPEMLIPSFVTDGVSVLVNGKAIESGADRISFAEDFTVTVMSEAGDSKKYKISLNCPQINTELPVLHIKPSSLVESKDRYVQTGIILYDKSKGGSTSGWFDGYAEIRGRGNSTWILPKKPYRIKFPEKVSPIGLDHASAKSWVILAHDMDKSLIRNHMAFEYSKVMFNPAEGYHDKDAILFTPNSKFVNVYMTGEYYYSDSNETKTLKNDYLGVYQMSDQMERSGGRIEVEKLEASDGNNPDKITGGYILESDVHEGDKISSRGIRFNYKYPKDDDCDPAQYDYIKNHVEMAENVLYGPDFKDPVNGWRKYFDEKTLADFIIIKEFAGDMDGFTSTYLYKRRGNDKFFFGPIWDCDKGWDNDKRLPYREYQPLTSLMINAGFRMPGAKDGYDWFRRFWEDETFRAFVNARWIAKKAELNAVTEMVLNEIPANMAKAIEANFTVWPFYYQFSSEAKMPSANYSSEIEHIRELSRQRSNLLDRLFAE